MQANNAIPYLQTPMPQQTEYRGTSNKSEKDDSFSKALGKELSQGKGTEKPTAEKPAPEKPTDVQEPAQDVSDGQVAPVVPLVIQNAYIEQPVIGEMFVPTMQEPVAAIQESAVAEIPVEEPVIFPQKGAEQLISTDDAKNQFVFQQTGEVSKAAPAAVDETLKGAVPQTEEKVTVSAVNTETKPEIVKTAASEIKPVVTGEESQQVQTEVKDTNLADMSKAIRQDMAGRQASFEAPAPVPQQTVDMTDVKAGIQKLSQTMADQMAKGKTELEIWLEPANLGKMAIKVAYESGRAMVSIMCTNEKTMELISQNARNLGNILEQHTGNNTVVVVEHPESDYLQQQAEQENKGGHEENRQQSGKQDDDSDDAQSFLQQLRLGLAQ